jgi:hypothetical protein
MEFTTMEYKVIGRNLAGEHVEQTWSATDINTVIRIASLELHRAGFFLVSVMRAIVLPAKEAC